VQFGTPYPATPEPPLADPLPRTPLPPEQNRPMPPVPPAPDPQAPFPPVPDKKPDPDVNRRPLTMPNSVDIDNFVQVADRIAVGRQPFSDGITWLANEGYRSVVYLRSPDSDDQAARRMFEKKGLRYFSIEVTPGTVSRETLEQLQRILKDEKNLPVFLYDSNGYLVGGLWYLRLRQSGVEEGRAREEALRLGLNPELNAQHRAMWEAVQRLTER
jgi:protein tyrosine phosphatase (PTP) superfamily phosphohydrolase (DUF442 family)